MLEQGERRCRYRGSSFWCCNSAALSQLRDTGGFTGKAEVMVTDQENYRFVPSNPCRGCRCEPEAHLRSPAPRHEAQGDRFHRGRRSASTPRKSGRAERRRLRSDCAIRHRDRVEPFSPEIEVAEARTPYRYARPTAPPRPMPSTASAKPADRRRRTGRLLRPAYEFALILDTELKRRKLRDWCR